MQSVPDAGKRAACAKPQENGTFASGRQEKKTTTTATNKQKSLCSEWLVGVRKINRIQIYFDSFLFSSG